MSVLNEATIDNINSLENYAFFKLGRNIYFYEN